jgi:ABC-type multidrug transport system fused ATPase/permease subunit
LILFKILKLFGLDVPAKIEAAKASLERRVEQAADHVKKVAVEAAVIAALSVIASITAAMAVGVGLIALYRWTADAYSAYAALGVVGAILVVATVTCATTATIKSKSLALNGIKLPRPGITAVPTFEIGLTLTC